MFKQELKKLMIKKHIFVLLILFLALYIILNLTVPEKQIYKDKVQQEKYMSYQQYLAGPLTSEKEKFILSEQEEYTQSKQRVQQIVDDYSSGKISDVEYDNLIEAESVYMINEPVFKEIKKHYNYVKADPGNRYFLDYSGWNSLLSKESVNYILVFFLLISTAMIFTSENDSGMSVINSACKYGKKKLTSYKLLMGFIIGVFASLVFSLTDIFLSLSKGTLSHGGFPAQSLPLFADYTGGLTLNEMLITVDLLNLIGCCYAVALIMCTAAVSKSTIITLFLNLSINTIPYILSFSSRIKYLLPLPGGLLVGSGYFAGADKNTENGTLSVITSYELIALIIVVMIIMSMCIFLIFRCVPKRRPKKCK